MNRLNIILVSLIVFSACHQKPMTLEDLQKAKWDSLSKGVDYISLEDEKRGAFKNDSMELKLKGVVGSQVKAEMLFDKIEGDIDKRFSDMLKLHIPDSRAGYLRINLYEMTRPEELTESIYLRGDYGTMFTFSSDSTALKNIPGIRDVSFISKEAAKQKYLADTNDDWDNVLDMNPLPNSIEIKLNNSEWTEKSLNELRNSILDKLMMATDVSLPSSLIKKRDEFFFFEYKRK